MLLLGLLSRIAVILSERGISLLVARIIRQAGSRVPAGGVPVEEDPLTILKRRYARGELSREEYERMRHELE